MDVKSTALLPSPIGRENSTSEPPRWSAGQIIRRVGAATALAFVLVKYQHVTSSTEGQIPPSMGASTRAVDDRAFAQASPVIYDSSKTTDLGWVPTGLPKHSRLMPNPYAAPRKGHLPLGRREGRSQSFGNFSTADLNAFWDKWIGDVYYPPLIGFPEPPIPYPIPQDMPGLYPSYFVRPVEEILAGLKYPPGFLFGWASAAQQYEGAVRADGKGPTIWDYGARFPAFTKDGTTSDVSDLGYYLYKQDIARLAGLGGNAYAFSVFWTRVLPFGMSHTPVNEDGLRYYEDLVAYCRGLDVEPIMTLFHWDTPLAIQLEYGAFASPRVVDDYLHYAEIMFRRFNGTVNTWFTFNEPGVFCAGLQYPMNYTLPLNVTSEQYTYVCRRHVILAHAKAYHLFKQLNIQGQIAFKSDDYLGVPWREGNADDLEAVERHMQYSIGFFADPIYLTGDWPELAKANIPRALLPPFSEEEQTMIKGTADLFSIDGYRENWLTGPEGGLQSCVHNRSHPAWPECTSQRDYNPSPYGWGMGDFSDPNIGWLHGSWQYMRPLLLRLSKRYPTNGGIYLTEFGFAEPNENDREYIHQATQDTVRSNVVLTYLAEVLRGVAEDGIPIKGVFAWSLTDNWEWNAGFTARFGNQHVDYAHPTLRRTFKRSAIEMSKFWASHRTKDASA